MRSVFSTPLVTPVLRLLASAALRLAGWKASLPGMPPPPYVLIGAPHTSNWDLLLMLCTLLHLKQEARWLGKTSLFVMLAVDAAGREIRLLGQYRPTGNAEREIEDIQRRYCCFGGIIPENAFDLHDPSGMSHQ